ncbi:hypothetical protein N7516_004131 [Penicillium verrucosum]|uniref:uncharacterized protein n=1 Tax=Penicillium verrucosum TaxID=60171 RepID=UPI002544D7F2|nr:uncharacterized protein N7516_004131 [Penicillium verrucosum]KAJ5943963.1 hypothetical protein N7516_004131 [Penicillium verrucosum]
MEAPRANECCAVGEKTSSPPGDDIKENVYPDPIYGAFGEIDKAPGYWANRALIAPWARVTNQRKTPGSLLYHMGSMPLLREPTLQENRKNNKRKIVDGEQFNAQVGRARHTAEAMIAYAVGQRLPLADSCECCQRNDGKFAACVLVPGQEYCSNCLWARREDRCVFSSITSAIPKRQITHRKRKSKTILEATTNKRPTPDSRMLSTANPGALHDVINRLETHLAGLSKGVRDAEELLQSLRAIQQSGTE